MDTLINQVGLSEIISSFDPLVALTIFFIYIVVDALYAKYTLEVASYQAVKAATTGSLLYVLIALGVLSYTKNVLYIIPMAIGSWIGTYWVVKRAEKHKQQED